MKRLTEEELQKLTEYVGIAREAVLGRDEATRLITMAREALLLRGAMKITMIYSLPPNDISGRAEWRRMQSLVISADKLWEGK